MNTNEKSGLKSLAYEAPQVEIVEIAVEKGFAVSSVGVNSWRNDGHLGDYDAE